MIENCGNCGGTHYGSNVCPYQHTEVPKRQPGKARLKVHDGQITKFGKCHVCGESTQMTCSDCQIDLAAAVYVCVKKECRDAHEEKCGAVQLQKFAKLRKAAEAVYQIANPIVEKPLHGIEGIACICAYCQRFKELRAVLA